MLRKVSSALLRAVVMALGLGAAACGSESPSSSATTPPASAAPTPAPDDELPPSQLETSLPPAIRDSLFKPFTGDFDEMIERKLIRIGVTSNRTFYFVDRGVQRGLAYDYGVMMEQRLNEKLKSGNVKVHVLFVAMPRTKLLAALTEGRIDMAAGSLTITPERQAVVDFTEPTRTKVNDIVVTGPGSKPFAGTESLSGQRIYVRKESSYEASLKALNQKLEAAG